MAALVAILAASLLWAFTRGGESADHGSRHAATSSGTDAAPTTELAGEVPGAEGDPSLTADTDPGNLPTGAAGKPADPAAPKAPRPSATPTTTKDLSGKVWVRVGHLSGSGNARSRAFDLRGVDTRLVYLSKAGSLAVFIVDEVQGRDATAGFADLDCDRPCEGEMLLVTPAGRYHLEVDAPPGTYDIAIEEYRRQD